MSGVGSSSSGETGARLSFVADRSVGRKSATAAAITSASKAAPPSGAGQPLEQRRPELTGRADPDHASPRTAAGRSTCAGDRGSPRAPRSSAASTTATPILPVDRLPMKRTGSIGSAVPPAVTMM